ncbi:MAG: glycosyltransferase [Ginsengibacter sp.]
MKILHVIPSMNPSTGGPCEVVRNIIPELEKLNVVNEVVCLDNPIDNFNTKDLFKIISLGPSVNPWHYTRKLEPWLVKNLGRFDVVIVHALWLYHGYAFQKAFKKFKKINVSYNKEFRMPRYYVMPHGMLDPYFQQASERKLKAIRNRVYWKLIESVLINNADGLLFTCQSELTLARQSFTPYYPKNEINIGCGIKSPPPFETAMAEAFFEKCPQLNKQPFILFLSRIHEKKGVHNLIEAYSKIFDNLSNNPTEKVLLPKLVIAGPGLETPYGKKIQELIAKSDAMGRSVFFPGMIRSSAKWGAFYCAEAFILPSYQENFGIAVVEALACKKPVLISKQVNIWREIIEDGGGMAEDVGTAGAQNLIESWIKISGEDKKIMGEKAWRSFVKNFSVTNAAKQLFQLVTE